MRLVVAIVLLNLAASFCFGQKADSLTNKSSFKYLSNLPLREVATLMLNDKLEPSDNFITFKVMDSITAGRKEVRDFYFPVFFKIVNKADGALGEAVGSYVLDYSKKFPKEFASRFKCCYDQNDCCDMLKKFAEHAAWETLLSNKPLKEYNDLIDQLNKNHKKWRSDKILSLFIDKVDETREKEERAILEKTKN